MFEPVTIHWKFDLLISEQLLHPGYKPLITCGLHFAVSKFEAGKQ